MKSSTILVVGIGNLLLADEGVGIHAVQELQKIPHDQNIEILDGGTAGFELITHFKGKDKVFIIDAFKAELPAGTVLKFTIEELNFKNDERLSVHQKGLQELLYYSKELVPCPVIRLYGIVVKGCHNFSTSLTPEVQASLLSLVSMILRDITDCMDGVQ